MINLHELDLSHNKITQLTKTAIAKLKNLYTVNLSYNQIKKMNPQIFAPATKLANLKVDKFSTYKNLATLFAALPSLGLTTNKWSCEYVQNVTNALNNQKLLINFNFLDPNEPNMDDYICKLNTTTLNKIQKKRGIWDNLLRM